MSTPRTDAAQFWIPHEADLEAGIYVVDVRVARLLESDLAAAVARYRWLADKVLACDYGDNDTGTIGWIIRHCKGPAWIPGASIDAAIDAAMKEPRNGS